MLLILYCFSSVQWTVQLFSNSVQTSTVQTQTHSFIPKWHKQDSELQAGDVIKWQTLEGLPTGLSVECSACLVLLEPPAALNKSWVLSSGGLIKSCALSIRGAWCCDRIVANYTPQHSIKRWVNVLDTSCFLPVYVLFCSESVIDPSPACRRAWRQTELLDLDICSLKLRGSK